MLAARAAPTSKPRSTSQVVAAKAACLPLLEMYRAAVVARPRTWAEVEDDFVTAMEAFDANVATGVADIGDLQNGKGDFLNDLLALLLEGCAGIDLYSPGRKGCAPPHHVVDPSGAERPMCGGRAGTSTAPRHALVRVLPARGHHQPESSSRA